MQQKEVSASKTGLLAEAINYQQKAMAAWLKHMQKENDVFEAQSKAGYISDELLARINDLRDEQIIQRSRSLFFYMSLKFISDEGGDLSESDELALVATFEILNEI